MKMLKRSLAAVALLALIAACSDPTPTPTPPPTATPTPQTAPSMATPTPAPQATPTPAPTGPAVDRVIMAVAPPTDFSNLRRIPGQSSNWYIRPHYEYLVGFDKTTGAYIPQLATEWSLEPDGHSWRFKLRQGVQFPNGLGEFTADDVRFTWLMNILPDDVGSEANTLRNRVLDVEIVGPYEVVFRTEAPHADIFEVISELQGGMEIASKADAFSRTSGMLGGMPTESWATYEEDPRLVELAGASDPAADEPPLASTAPYQIIEMSEQTGVVYRARENHWRDTPDFPEFEFQFIPEASTRLAKLLAREAHLSKLPEELLAEAENRGFRTFTAQVPAARYFLGWQGVYQPAGGNVANDRVSASGVPAEKTCAFANQADEDAYNQAIENGTTPPVSCSAYPNSPFTDLRVRKALNKAIDRHALNDAFFFGKGLTMYKNHYLPNNPQRVGWNDEWETQFDAEYGYDPDAAKALLAEAGYNDSNPLSITMQLTQLPAVPAGVDVMQAIANYWRDIGVDVTEQRLDFIEYRNKQREIHWDSHISPVSTSGAQLITINVYGSSIVPILYISLQDPHARTMMEEAYRTNTPQDRDDILRELGDYYYYLHQDIPLFYLPNEVVGDPEIIEDFIFSGMVSGAPVDHLEGLVAK